ncbi:hypothetical protein B1759_15720 [Rubrivirga sp. SAORIC476]|uniref:ATP-binding protein n=1 Tax=Rubrivirga sp. SAORIC476 TaxID=1961794 RepID=UPI000BCB081C|nr:ATP-binding protein [Rubrivirga sp. SAORIC476]PAP78888.1 hypothetical protein B1759_15720 [Rubrivirga sp. SAORIC476]
MPAYTFSALSSVDFEDLVRDLLQEEWGVPLESFSAGRDDGVDLRYARSGAGTTVVQCKHYAGSTWSDLKKAVAQEVPKVRSLSLGRYVFVTSLPMNPGRKREVIEAFSPFIRTPADVIGPQEINGLLRDHAHVERRHPRLWLTSSAVLQRVLNGGLFERARILSDGLPDTLRTYVPHPSLGEARSLLDQLHYCVIAGIPGVGKTTLAEILAADLVGRGYELVVLNRTVSEALEVLDTSKYQALYFDDFLGMTALESLERNEDRDLLALFAEVRRSENTRLILTTREYILRQARAAHERLDRPGVDWAKCTVELEGYDTLHRARILYNHLLHSGLDRAYAEALLEERAYRKIVEHSNFSPRIVDWMTTPGIVEPDTPPAHFPERFVRALDRPDELWRHAYENHVSLASRHLLTVLASLPSGVLLDDLERAFWPLHTARSRQHRQPTAPEDFREALRELDGTFVATIHQVNGRYVARFHNPSIRDYVEARLAGRPHEARSLLATAVFFEQVHYLVLRRIASAEDARAALIRTFGVQPARLDFSVEPGRAHRRAPEGATGRAAFAVRTFRALPRADAEAVLKSLVSSAYEEIELCQSHEDAIVDLLDALQYHPYKGRISTPQSEAMAFETACDEVYDAETFGRLVDAMPDAGWWDPRLTEQLNEAVSDAFERVAKEEVDAAVSNYRDDPEMIESFREQVVQIAEKLDRTLPDDVVEAFDQAKADAEQENVERAAREAERATSSPEKKPAPSSDPQKQIDPVDSLFDTLRST